jgi:hypothetical protein
MSSSILKYFNLQKTEKFIDKYGLEKNMIYGLTNEGQTISIYVEDWVAFNLNEKIEYIEEFDGVSNRYIIPDYCFKHPIFEIGKTYKFQYVGFIEKARNVFVRFKGIDNRIYEVLKIGSFHSVNQKDKWYDLEFKNIKNGRLIFIYKIFYDIESIAKIKNIVEYFNEIKNIDQTEFSEQILSQYTHKDNRWVITFLNLLEFKQNDSYFRKDWIQFKKINQTYTELQNWVLNSGFLLLFSKDNQEKIKNRIEFQINDASILLEVVELNQNFKQVEFIESLKLDLLTDDIQLKLTYLLKSNLDLASDNKVINFLYKGIIEKRFKPDLIEISLKRIFNDINQSLVLFKKSNKVDGKKINESSLNKLLSLCIYIHNSYLSLNLIDKVKIILSKFCQILELSDDYKVEEILSLKKKIITQNIVYKLIAIEDFNSAFIFDFIKNLSVNEKSKERIKINDIIKCSVVSKSNFGVLLINKTGDFGILPRQAISRKLFEEIIVDSEIEINVNLINETLDFFIGSFKNNSIQINDIFKENQSKNVTKYDFQIGEIIECSVRKIVDYGVFLNLTDTQSGLLYIKNISTQYINEIGKWFYEGQKVNLVVVDNLNDKVQLSQIDLYREFFKNYIDYKITKIKIRSYLNDHVYLLIDDLYDIFLLKDDLEQCNFHDISTIQEFECLLCFKNDQISIKNIDKIKLKNLTKLTITYDQKTIHNLLYQKVNFLEESINLINDIDLKIEQLSWCRLIYSHLTNHKSYFVDYYILYLKIIKNFTTSLDFEKELLYDFIEKIDTDEKIKESFEVIEKLKENIKILSYLQLLNQDSFDYLSKMFLKDEFSNISKNVLLYNLMSNDKGFNKETIKQKITNLLLDSKLSDIEYDNDVIDEIKEEDPIVTELISIIRKGENKFVEFKSSLYTPIYNGNESDKNFNIDILIHSVMKNIVGFVNTKGGQLFIGVSDSGEIIGLDSDFTNYYKNTDPKDKNKLIDKFLQTLDNFVDVWLGNDIRKFMDVKIHQYQEKEFCVITLKEKERMKPYCALNSIEKKVTIKGKKGFYFRGEAGTREYSFEDLLDLLS